MAARAYWKGHLRLSLVTIEVELYSAAVSSSRPSLHQIHEPSGKRIRYQKVAPGVGPVDKDEIVRGFEVDKDEYVTLTDEELDAIKLESRSTINLVQFVDHCEIDPRYFDKPYYVVPQGGQVAAEGFAVIREALHRSKKVGLGQMAQRGRDHICAIKPCGDGLLLETLRYPEEVRESDSIFRDIPKVEIDTEMRDLAEELISRKTAPFDASAFHSQYTEALQELIAEKRRAGGVRTAADEELGEESNVVDLMAALKKSVERDRGAAGKKADDKASAGDTSSAKGKKGGSKSGTKSDTKSSAKSGGKSGAKSGSGGKGKKAAAG